MICLKLGFLLHPGLWVSLTGPVAFALLTGMEGRVGRLMGMGRFGGLCRWGSSWV